MSTSAVSSSSLNQQIQQYFRTRQTDLQQLGQALGTGDLAGAQTAFQAITQLGQGGPFASGDPFANSQREQDFTTIGQALQSGDLAGAQQAFGDLKATLEKNNGGQPVPVADPILTAAPPSTSTVGPEIILNLSNSSGSANPEQITININPTSGGGEQVSLSVGQGSNTPQVTLNLPANSNEEIILNLLGGSSSTSSASTSSTSSSSPASGSSANGGLSVSA
jgi:hypothetical protein